VAGRQHPFQPAGLLELRREGRRRLLDEGARLLLRDVVVDQLPDDERPLPPGKGDREAVPDPDLAAGPAPRAVQVDLPPLARGGRLGPRREEAGDVEEEVEPDAGQNVGFSTDRSNT
jgi:hypothetical protein